MAAAPSTELRLGLAAKAENLALVRQALSGFADGVSIPEGPLADLKQIATEACMNAVIHAYPGRDDGRIDVHAIASGREVELRIRDWGIGFKPRPAQVDGSLRLGLPLIASVVNSFGIESPDGGGTALFARIRTDLDGEPVASDMPRGAQGGGGRHRRGRDGEARDRACDRDGGNSCRLLARPHVGRRLGG